MRSRLIPPVCGELLISTKNSAIRHTQGIFAILAEWGPRCSRKSLAFSRVFVRIPYSTEQGIILKEQGIFST